MLKELNGKMVTPAVTREAIAKLVETFQVSQRQLARLQIFIAQWRDMYRDDQMIRLFARDCKRSPVNGGVLGIGGMEFC
jgi:hypothetical protein